MNTFYIPGADANAPELPVHVPSQIANEITSESLQSFPAFKTWINTLRHSLALQEKRKDHPFHAEPYSLQGITIQSVDRFSKGNIGFVKMKADVANDKGEKLPGIMLLRGGAVAMMVILQPDDIPEDSDMDKHIILTMQPRIPTGTLSMLELPAGMIDDKTGNFAGAAAAEIEEELGMSIPASELLDLTALAMPKPENPDDDEILQQGIYTSGGGTDEFIAIFLHEKRLPRSQLDELNGKLTGLRDHGEKITLKVVKLEDAWKVGSRDSKMLGGWALYTGLKKEGKI